MIATVTLTQADVQLIIVFLSAILVLLGFIGRQQIRWMSRIEDKVNNLQIRQAVMSAVLKIPNDDKESARHE